MEELNRSGVLIVDKPAGVTSQDAVNIVRRLYGTRQVGHTGTLDPMATGVLPVLVGRAVKASEYLLAENKRYQARLKLGLTTDTEDTDGKILSVCSVLPGAEEVARVCASVTGEQRQVPPMYSALKRNGKKLVDLARAGITVEREPRLISIYELNVRTVDEAAGLYELDVLCSKGTYIRSLCRDIGAALGCGGVMAGLRRTASGPFGTDCAHTLGELESMTEAERAALLLPLERLFEDLPALRLPPFYRRLSSSGCAIDLKKLGADLPDGRNVRLYDGDLFYALGRVQKTEEGRAVRAVKQFVLFDKDGKPC